MTPFALTNSPAPVAVSRSSIVPDLGSGDRASHAVPSCATLACPRTPAPKNPKAATGPSHAEGSPSVEALTKRAYLPLTSGPGGGAGGVGAAGDEPPHATSIASANDGARKPANRDRRDRSRALLRHRVICASLTPRISKHQLPGAAMCSAVYRPRMPPARRLARDNVLLVREKQALLNRREVCDGRVWLTVSHQPKPSASAIPPGMSGSALLRSGSGVAPAADRRTSGPTGTSAIACRISTSIVWLQRCSTSESATSHARIGP